MTEIRDQMIIIVVDIRTQRIQLYRDLVTNINAITFLHNPKTKIYLEKLQELLLRDKYMKVKQRLPASVFLRLCRFFILEKHSGFNCNILENEVIGLSSILEKRPKTCPVIQRQDRDRINYFLENYFKPLLDVDGSIDVNIDYFSESDEHDLDEEYRDIPTCTRCGHLSWRICSNCKRVSYCGIICQQLHWSEHKKDCKEKKE